MMKKTNILLALLIAFLAFGVADAQRSKSKRASKPRTQKTVKRKTASKKKTVKKKVVRKKVAVRPPTIHENSFVQCEDTCEHIHGIDLSHYQGEVFWETVGENTRTAYVYLKATEGSDRIDSRYERNIDLAHRYGVKVGSYHFFRPRTNLTDQLENFKTQCLPGEQDLIPMLDVETTGGLEPSEFCDSLFTFLYLMEEAYHQKPLIYTGRNFYNKYLMGLLDDYQLMIAMYTDEEPELADGRDILMWQYTSKGRINGVSGNVDKSRFMGNHTLREIRFRH